MEKHFSVNRGASKKQFPVSLILKAPPSAARIESLKRSGMANRFRLFDCLEVSLSLTLFQPTFIAAEPTLLRGGTHAV